MGGAFPPVHLPRPAPAGKSVLPQVAPAQGGARAVEAKEPDWGAPPGAQLGRRGTQAAVFGMTAGAVSADENRLPIARCAGLENRGGFLIVDGDAPLHRLTYTGSPGCAPPRQGGVR